MNEQHFVLYQKSIEGERPDIGKYLLSDAVQAMGLQGGWH